MQAAEQQDGSPGRQLETNKRKAQKIQGNLHGQAKNTTTPKLKQNGDREANIVQAPKVCLLPEMPPCLVW